MVRKKEKLELELLVICDYAIISRDNKLTIAGIFDQIFINKVPSQQPKMFVVGVIEGKADSAHNLTLQVNDPGGKEVFPKQNLAVKLGPNGKTNLIAQVGNLPLASIGTYKVQLGHDGKTIGEKELGVFASKPQNASPKRASKYTN